MIKITNIKYIFYILIFIIFVIARLNYLLSENEIIDIEFKSIAIASNSFPFGIISNTLQNDIFLPIYYFLIHFFTYFINDTLYIKIFNTIISLINVFLLIKVGKKILNPQLGYLLGFIFSINHFYIYYTNLIAPYCLDFLLGTILIMTILDFIKKPNKKHTKFLLISNSVFLIISNLAIFYVVPELFLLNKIFEKNRFIKKNIIKISFYSFLSYLIPFIFLLIQYFNYTNVLISNNYNGVGLNFESLYLLLNEYLTPFLSFDMPNIQTNSTFGMMHSFLFNPDFKNINSIKILLTLFYGSILPFIMLVFFVIKTLKKNSKLRLLFLMSFVNFLILLIFMFYQKIDTHPIYMLQFYLTILILFGYGISSIKDTFIQKVVIFCFFAIQFINPELNSFNLTINKKFPVNSALNVFIKENNLQQEDLIIMPYMGKYAKMYYKDLNILDFDNSMLQKNNKKGILRNLCKKDTNSINKNNIKDLLSYYLSEKYANSYLTKYFIDNILPKDDSDGRIIFLIDKLNSKPISQKSIEKFVQNYDYNTKMRKIKYSDKNLAINDTRKLFDAVKSKTLYNFLDISSDIFYLEKIVQYKKIDNEYFKKETDSQNINDVLTSRNSDYIFIIFKIYR